jgi:hypothetical protein
VIDGGASGVPLDHVIRALRRRWWLPVAAAVVAGAMGLIVANHVHRGQVGAATYDAQAIVTVQDDPLVFRTNWPLVKSDDPAWVPEQIALLAGPRTRAIVARKTGVPETAVRDHLSARALGAGSFVIAISDLPHATAQRALAAALDAFLFRRREQVRGAASFDEKRVLRVLDRLQARLAKVPPKSAAAANLEIRQATVRGELAVDRALMSVDPSGVTVGSTSLTSRTAVVDPSRVTIAALLVGLAVGCLAALIAEGAKTRRIRSA